MIPYNTTRRSDPAHPTLLKTEPRGEGGPLPLPMREAQVEGTPPPSFPRFPGETPRAYGAFLAYFQLGPARTLQLLADKLGQPLQTIKNWSSSFDWSDRLHSFYSGLLQQEAAAQAACHRQQAADWSRRLDQLRQQEWDASQKLLAAAQCFLESFGEEDLRRMTLAQVSRALKISSTLARLAAAGDGLPDTPEPAHDSFQQQLMEAVHRVYSTPVPAQTPVPTLPVSSNSPLQHSL